MADIDYKFHFEKAISYLKYKEAFQAEMDEGTSKMISYLPQNWQRQSRLDRKFKFSEELQAAINSITRNKKWLVITEHWCGDAAQINPIINHIAEASEGKIELRMIYRDENEALIDAHLTDGRSRSIPILIELDENYKVLKTYGPRPAEAQKLVKSILEKGESYAIPLHTWYAKDKQASLSADFVDFLKE